jgi:hypothetical protein
MIRLVILELCVNWSSGSWADGRWLTVMSTIWERSCVQPKESVDRRSTDVVISMAHIESDLRSTTQI